MTPQLTKYFYANIFDLLGVQDLPAEKKRELLDSITDTLETRLFLRLVQGMTEEERKEFADILADDSKTDEDKTTFIREKFPDFSQILETEIALVKKELKESVDQEVFENAIAEEVINAPEA